jgi:hypothetical protein
VSASQQQSIAPPAGVPRPGDRVDPDSPLHEVHRRVEMDQAFRAAMEREIALGTEQSRAPATTVPDDGRALRIMSPRY